MTKNKRVHYGLIGTGPIGCTIGAHLAQSGARLSAFVIDQKQVEAFKTKPIIARGALNASGPISSVCNDITSFLNGRPDVIILATKSCQSPSILESIRANGGLNESVIVSCQNGIDVEN